MSKDQTEAEIALARERRFKQGHLILDIGTRPKPGKTTLAATEYSPKTDKAFGFYSRVL